MSNDYRAYVECDYNSIYHYGVKGQKWGMRRYQNSDGTLTPEGEARYRKYQDKYRKAGYSDSDAALLAKRDLKNHASRRQTARNAAGLTAGLGFMVGNHYVNNKIADKMVDNKYTRKHFGNSVVDDMMAARTRAKERSFGTKAKNLAKSGGKKIKNLAGKHGFTEKYVSGHTLNADSILDPIMKTRLSKKGKIGLGIAGAAALAGAGGYALYKHNKKKKQNEQYLKQRRNKSK